MISWITASHDQEILDANLLATLPTDPAPICWIDETSSPSLEVRRAGDPKDGDELIIVRGAGSIAQAYNAGGHWASNGGNDIRCYLHHDVQILDFRELRDQLIHHCMLPGTGVVGVIGSLSPSVPWWEASALDGSVLDAKLGKLFFGRGGGGAAVYLDGLLLATARPIGLWDTSYSGWHMYDHDICQRMLFAGFTNRTIEGGHRLVLHNRTNSTDTSKLPGWDSAVSRFREVWRSPLERAQKDG